jgi:SAM-dependent methyltransferase
MARFDNAIVLMRALGDPRSRHMLIEAARAHQRMPAQECPCCGTVAVFQPYGTPPQLGVECPKCTAFERHRLFWLHQKRHGFIRPSDRVLHFAAEDAITNLVKPMVAEYKTADLMPERGDLTLNIEAIDLPGGRFDAVICSHVLEHVNDRKALAEIHRTLSPGGRLVAMVPVIEGWDSTYEDPSIVTEDQREIHFGQYDHVRYYGRDFRDRVKEAGFQLTEYTSTGAECVKYGVQRGERIFICSKLPT